MHARTAINDDTARHDTRHMQISVLEFDIATNDLRTISLHYFEDYKVKVQPLLHSLPLPLPPHLRARG
jgi:hypothetical protein